MKIRRGFVSNSSSSSFIIGLAKIVDFEKFNKFTESIKNFSHIDCRVVSLEDIYAGNRYEITVEKGNLVMESFTGARVMIDIDEYLKTEHLGQDWPQRAKIALSGMGDKDIVEWQYYPDEGDGTFSVYDDDGEWLDTNYNISLDHFPDYVQNFYNGLNEKNGVVLVDLKYGAGRNG